jgi:hypothetical protein
VCYIYEGKVIMNFVDIMENCTLDLATALYKCYCHHQGEEVRLR